MKDIDEASRLIVELARLLIREMQAMGKPWKKAFLRSEIADGVQTHNGSFVLGDAVYLFDVLEHKTMLSGVHEIAPQLHEATANEEKRFCVALLMVDSNFNYEVQYEYDDVGRWAISKLGDGTGIPAGYAV
jgi:hypothetical protein